MPQLPFPLLLASSSPARRVLLSRLNLIFSSSSPDIDEATQPGESAIHLTRRLSEAKARALAADNPNTLIIGSDQALTLDDEILGKPGNHERAQQQLAHLSGRTVTFHTGLCLLNTQSGHCQVTVEPFEVSFRQLGAEQIERYLKVDEPYGCAGSFKSETLGITLFERFNGRDPNSLIGLPLMALVDFLLAEGIILP
ncbi:MAG TPA: nucleoside triphosphate pyrophosphatase [Moraxellaceae bacterium]|nr:nucleoside triphosphate pyrophosphatase [Moraxellaceae bacterium]